MAFLAFDSGFGPGFGAARSGAAPCIDWIDRNQLARRNPSPDEFKLVLGRRYERVKKTIPNPDGAGGKSGKIVGYQNDTDQSGKTRQHLAKEHGVGEATVQRAARYARAVETVKQIDPDIEEKIHAKEAPPSGLTS